MKKIIFSLTLILFASFLAGCTAKPEEKKEETINPFSPTSMVDTYETSKGKINDATQKQNAATSKALEESGINE
jgi:PBP1b-binding outer membrane lipoprotein LpoB